MPEKRRKYAIAFAATLALCAPTARAQATAPTPALASEQLGDVLLGRVQPVAARADAAARLAAEKSPTAASILAQALQSLDPEITTAAAKALAESDWPDRQFVQPLEHLLGPNQVLNAYVADALDQYGNDPTVAARLLVIARDSNLPPAARAPVVRALGEFSSKDVAAALIRILQDADDSDEVRQAAAVALAEMSGLSELGQDGIKWQTWWLTVRDLSSDDFAVRLARQRSERFAQVVVQADRLDRSLDRLLKSLYFTSQPTDQPRLLEAYLSDEAWQIRCIGAQIVEIDTGGGHPMSLPARAHLRSMLAFDGKPDVRAAAAGALGLDPTSGDLLLARLAQETDLNTRVALLNALALRQDPRAITQAVVLLSDPSVAIVQAATDLLTAGGPLLRDPKQTVLRQQAETALLAVLDTNPAAHFQSLRRSLASALAALGDPALHDRLVHLTAAKESDAVRSAAIGGLGLLAQNSPPLAAMLADFADGRDVPAALRLKAVQELANVPTTAYVDRLVDRLHKQAEPQDDIRQAIWQTVTVWMGNMDDPHLLALAGRLAREGDYPREIDVRRFCVQRLEAQKPPSDQALRTAALQRQAIALREMNSLRLPKEAAADFAQEIVDYQSRDGATAQTKPVALDLPHAPFGDEAAALLAAGPPYQPAVKFAADTLADPRLANVAPAVLQQFATTAAALAADPANAAALNNAVALANAFADAKLALPASLSPVAEQIARSGESARQKLTTKPS